MSRSASSLVKATLRVSVITVLRVVAAVVSTTPAYATVITATGGLNITAVAGTQFSGPVATFTDSNAAATPANFAATINWGDATPVSAGAISVNGQVFTVTGSHTYANPGSFTVTVAINDVSPGTGSATVTDTATVASPSTVITATGGLNIAAVAGTPFTGTVATFTDSNTAATPASFTATINWGDATMTTGAITANGQLFSVTGSHTYAIAGSFTVTVKISDVSPGTGTATVTDTATVASPITATPVNFNAVAGSPFTGTVATFTDINAAATPASFTATINWGDGSTSAGAITVNGQVFSVTGSHTYATFGSFQVIVTISDVPPGNGTATATDTATVAALNAPTLTKAFGADQINPGDTVTATFTLHNPNTTSLTGVAFTDTLPIGLAAQSLTATACGGGVLTAAGSTISLTGGTLPANATCQFSVDVTVQALAGTLTNPAITITSNEALPGTSAPAEIFVSPLFFLWFFAS
jgi:hypothetical protein